MGLDAHVYCDCYEKGKMREPPPVGVSLRVEPDGGLGRDRATSTLEDDVAWDRWRRMACEHRDGMLIHRRLGNISLIGFFRSELQREALRFPVLLTKVLYSGSHAGDHITAAEVSALLMELKALADFSCSTTKGDAFLSKFRSQMSELVAASFSVMKPIVF